jgi:hypothetical protein
MADGAELVYAVGDDKLGRGRAVRTSARKMEGDAAVGDELEPVRYGPSCSTRTEMHDGLRGGRGVVGVARLAVAWPGCWRSQQGLGTQTRCRDAEVWSLQGGGAHARRRSKTFEDGDEGTYVGDVWEIMASVLGAGLLGVERSGRPDQGR